MRNLIAKVLLLVFIFILAACQDQAMEEIIQNDIDQDMINARNNVEEYLSTLKGRTTINSTEVTVLRNQNGLIYRTESSSSTYLTLYEQTITAVTTPGTYIFWQAGIGLGELVGIDFDEESEEYLGNNLPFEVTPGETWGVFIPDNYDEEDDEIMLKYDILYQTVSGQIIRFDPKIQIKGVN